MIRREPVVSKDDARRKAPDDGLPTLEIVEAEPVDEEPAVEALTAEALGLDLPDDPAEALPIVLAAVAQARMDADQYLDDLRRVAADFENYRKRTQREMAGIVERASERVVRQLLPVLDSFEAAMAVEPKTETEEKLLVGIRNTYDLLLDVLVKEGLEPIETWDQPFDPTVHEAVVATGECEGTMKVTQDLRRGYKLRGKVLRAALVAVAPEQAGNDSPGPNE
ncbi:MAG: nucleotide exchange factor GrpE [Acidimicrobiia bacterium]